MISVPSFPDEAQMARLTAAMLLEIEAIHIRPDRPFTLTSGLVSPVYVDCRKIISFPRVRATVMDFAASLILRRIGCEQLDSIAGGETAGIPFAAWLADRLGLPMHYIRKKPKGFGRDAQIEGTPLAGQRTLLVEDLATNGGSKITFCDAIRTAGGTVSDSFVIFAYDIFTDTRLRDQGVTLHHLCCWRDVLDFCQNTDRLSPDDLTAVTAFLDNPLDWSAAHGGIAGESRL